MYQQIGIVETVIKDLFVFYRADGKTAFLTGWPGDPVGVLVVAAGGADPNVLLAEAM